MRIFAVTPIFVGAEELARRQARYDALCPPGLNVVLHDIGPQAPPALNSSEDVRASEACVVEALKGAPAGFDALLPDCVLDPGVNLLADSGPVPVLGLLRISVGWSACLGRSCGAVARNAAIAAELAEKVHAYGWSAWFTDVEVLDLDVEAITDSSRWAGAVGSALDRFEQSGTATIVNGCSAVDLPADAEAGRARLVDPTALALRLLAAGQAA